MHEKKYAKIKPESLEIIRKAEREIDEKSGEKIILIAYDKEGK